MAGVPDLVGQAQERLLGSTMRSITGDELSDGRRQKKTNLNSLTRVAQWKEERQETQLENKGKHP